LKRKRIDLVSGEKMKKLMLSGVLCLVVVGLFTICVYASETLGVSPFGEIIRNVNLNQGDSIYGTCSMSSAYSPMGAFYVIGPDSSVPFSRSIADANQFDFSVTAHIAGTYKIRVWNMNMLSSATVTLNYSVSSTVPDFLRGDNLLLVMIIALTLMVCVILLLVWRSKMKNRQLALVNQQTTLTPPPILEQALCPFCNQPMVYITQYQRWYCLNEKKYI
jgi:hypothetical protein